LFNIACLPSTIHDNNERLFYGAQIFFH